jgi:hypothetical protein
MPMSVENGMAVEDACAHVKKFRRVSVVNRRPGKRRAV